ncbi:MAG: hypothetical protein K5829_08900 [Treponema sp.]|nr:hypothetical protein [Treponema sp.]
MNDIYNIIADLCSFVIKNCSEDFFVQYSCVSLEEKERNLEYVKEFIQVKKLSEADLNEEYYKSLNLLVSKVIAEGDFF